MTATPGGQLRELMAGEPFIAVECHSPLTARIVQRGRNPGGVDARLPHRSHAFRNSRQRGPYDDGDDRAVGPGTSQLRTTGRRRRVCNWPCTQGSPPQR